MTKNDDDRRGWLHSSTSLLDALIGVETPKAEREAAEYYLRQGVNAADHHAKAKDKQAGVGPLATMVVISTRLSHAVAKARSVGLAETRDAMRAKVLAGWRSALLTGNRLIAETRYQQDGLRVVFKVEADGGVSYSVDYFRECIPYATLHNLHRPEGVAAVTALRRLSVLSDALDDDRLLRRANDIARLSGVRLFVWRDKRDAVLPVTRAICFLDTVYIWGAVLERDYLHATSLDFDVIVHAREAGISLASRAMLDNPPETGGAFYVPALL